MSSCDVGLRDLIYQHSLRGTPRRRENRGGLPADAGTFLGLPFCTTQSPWRRRTWSSSKVVRQPAPVAGSVFTFGDSDLMADGGQSELGTQRGLGWQARP
jgi:hypothetical protein